MFHAHIFHIIYTYVYGAYKQFLLKIYINFAVNPLTSDKYHQLQ